MTEMKALCYAMDLFFAAPTKEIPQGYESPRNMLFVRLEILGNRSIWEVCTEDDLFPTNNSNVIDGLKSVDDNGTLTFDQNPNLSRNERFTIGDDASVVENQFLVLRVDNKGTEWKVQIRAEHPRKQTLKEQIGEESSLTIIKGKASIPKKINALLTVRYGVKNKTIDDRDGGIGSGCLPGVLVPSLERPMGRGLCAAVYPEEKDGQEARRRTAYNEQLDVVKARMRQVDESFKRAAAKSKSVPETSIPDLRIQENFNKYTLKQTEIDTLALSTDADDVELYKFHLNYLFLELQKLDELALTNMFYPDSAANAENSLWGYLNKPEDYVDNASHPFNLMNKWTMETIKPKDSAKTDQVKNMADRQMRFIAATTLAEMTIEGPLFTFAGADSNADEKKDAEAFQKVARDFLSMGALAAALVEAKYATGKYGGRRLGEKSAELVQRMRYTFHDGSLDTTGLNVTAYGAYFANRYAHRVYSQTISTEEGSRRVCVGKDLGAVALDKFTDDNATQALADAQATWTNAQGIIQSIKRPLESPPRKQ